MAKTEKEILAESRAARGVKEQSIEALKEKKAVEYWERRAETTTRGPEWEAAYRRKAAGEKGKPWELPPIRGLEAAPVEDIWGITYDPQYADKYDQPSIDHAINLMRQMGTSDWRAVQQQLMSEGISTSVALGIARQAYSFIKGPISQTEIHWARSAGWDVDKYQQAFGVTYGERPYEPWQSSGYIAKIEDEYDRLHKEAYEKYVERMQLLGYTDEEIAADRMTDWLDRTRYLGGVELLQYNRAMEEEEALRADASDFNNYLISLKRAYGMSSPTAGIPENKRIVLANEAIEASDWMTGMYPEFFEPRILEAPPEVAPTPEYRELTEEELVKAWKKWEYEVLEAEKPLELPWKGQIKTDTGEKIEVIITKDKKVWEDNKQIGLYNPETGGIEPVGVLPAEAPAPRYAPSVGEVYPQTPLETLGAVAYPLEFISKRGAEVLTAPFRPPAKASWRPPTKEEMAKGIYAYQPTGAAARAYEEWEEPTFDIPFLPLFHFPWTSEEERARKWRLGPKGAAEEFMLLPFYLAGISGGSSIWKQVSKIEVKQAAGKTLTEAEKKLLASATQAEARISEQIKKGIVVTKDVHPLPSTEAVIAQMEFSQAAKGLKFVPGIKQIVGVINKKAVATNPVDQAKVIQGTLLDMAEGRQARALVHLDNLITRGAKPKIKDGIVIDSRVVALENAPKLPTGKASMHAHDIVEYAERYAMPDNLKAYFNEIRNISKQATKMLEFELDKYGLKMRKLAGESDWVYLRRVVTKVGDVEKLRLGFWRDMQKSRVFSLAEEAAIAPKPVVYLAPELELQYQLEAAYGWITQLRTKELLAELTTTAKARVPAKVIEGLIAVNERRIVADKLVGTARYAGLITRVGRGEKLAPATLAMVRRQFPEMADELGRLMQVTAKRTAQATALKKKFSPTAETARAEFLEAKAVYKRALEQAGPRIDEAMSFYLPGKIFTTQTLAGKKVLGREVMEMVEKQFGYHKPGLIDKAIKGAGWVGAILRQTKAAVDLSVQGIQTLAVLGIDVKNLVMLRPTAYWIKGAARGWQRAFSPKGAFAFLDKPEVKALWDEMIGYGALFNRSEFAEATHILGRIPVAGFLYERTGAAFTIGRQATQTYLLMGERVRALKGIVGEVARDKRLTELAHWSNIATGVISTRGMGISSGQRAAENVLLFAPRYVRATLTWILDVAKGGYTGAQAREALAGFLAAAYTQHTFTAMALGQKPRLNPLPESLGGDGAKWLTIKVGSAYIGFGGTVYTLGKLMGQIWETALNHPDDLIEIGMDNPAVRYARSKLGPPGSLLCDIVTGHDFLGELTRDNIGQVAKTFGEWGIPIWIEGIFDALEAGSTGWQVFPVGVTELFGGRSVPETDWDKLKLIRELYAEADYNRAYKDLPQGYIKEMRRKHPDLDELEQKVKDRRAEIGSDMEKWYYEESKGAKEKRDKALEEAAKAVFDGTMSKSEYDSDRGYTRPFYSGYRAALWTAKEHLDPDTVKDIERWIERKQTYSDKALSAYQEYRAELIEKAVLPRDWDFIEASLEAYLAQYPQEIREYIVWQRDAWVEDLPENAQRLEKQRLHGMAIASVLDDYRDKVARKAYGLPWADIKRSQQEQLRENNPDIVRLEGASWWHNYSDTAEVIAEREAEKVARETMAVGGEIAELVSSDPTFLNALAKFEETKSKDAFSQPQLDRLYEIWVGVGSPATLDEWLESELPKYIG